MASKYVYQIEFDVKTEMGDVWTNGLTEVLEAYEKAGEQVPEVYTTHVGGGERAYIRVYCDCYADMDKWTHVPDLISQMIGKEKSIPMLKEWATSFSGWESRILRLSPDGH